MTRITIAILLFMVAMDLGLRNKAHDPGPLPPIALSGGTCDTATTLDADCDGFGVGETPDADDTDPSVNTAASMIAKYDPATGDALVALRAFLPARRGITPLHYVFIAPTGNDSNCAADSVALPCASINKANSLAVAGGAVVWRAGTYTIANFTFNGKSGISASQPIVYMAFPGEAVVLQENAGGNLATMDGQSYWSFIGLKLVGFSTGFGVSYANNFAVHFGSIIDTEILGFYDGVFAQQALDNFRIEGSYIHNDDTHLGQEHNIYLGCADTPGPGTCPNVILRHSIVANSPGGGHNLHANGNFTGMLVERNQFYGAVGNCLGLQMGVTGGLFQNNTCHTVASAAIWLITYGQTSNLSIKCHNLNNNTFRNNTFIDDGQTWNTNVGGTDGSEPVLRVTDQCASIDYAAGVSASNIDHGHNTYDSNIFVHWCQDPNCTFGHGPVLMYDGARGATWLSTDTYTNNVIVSLDTVGGGFLNLNGVTQSFAWFAANVPLASGNINSAPTFKAFSPFAWQRLPNSWDLHLVSATVGCGAASANGLAVDLYGTPRGVSSDIGAIQSCSSAGGGITVSPVTGFKAVAK